jgi:peptide/nickel transport system substrate-binding protein
MRRRDALKYALLGTVGAVGISVLEACGRAPAPTAPAVAPTTPPAPAKPTQAAGAPTSPPAATAPKPTAAPAVATPNPTAAPVQSTLKKGGTVTLGTAQDFPGLDPMMTTLFNANNLHTLIWQGLTRFDVNMDVQPDLAEKWDVVDPKTFVFYLRKGVHFHNGREAVADDVKFSIDRVKDPNTKSPYITYVEKIDTVQVVDNYTVKLNLSKPNAVQPDELTRIKIMPKEAAADFVNKPVGTGPYQFVEFVPGDHVTMKRFDGYWDQPKPFPDQFIIRVVKDEVSALNALKAGQFDILWQLQPPDVKSVQESSNLTVVSPKMSGNSLILQVDNSQPPFDNKYARQGLLYATDKTNIFDLTAFQIGWLSKTNSSLVPTHWGFNTSLKEREFNTQKAKELFREAGVKDGLELNYNTIAGRAGWRIQGEMLQQSLNECGIKLNIVASDLAQWASLRTPGKHYQGWINPNGNERAWDPSQQLKGYTSNETISKVYYANPEVDALLDQGVSTFARDERKKIYDHVQEILWEDVPWVTTHHYVFNHAAGKHIQGLFVDGQGDMHFEGIATVK